VCSLRFGDIEAGIGTGPLPGLARWACALSLIPGLAALSTPDFDRRLSVIDAL